ncbi:unnamed protein product [Closterium sp. Yama58-4]|nr:unnamed protein product [Closterium sp. Yama58-4]
MGVGITRAHVVERVVAMAAHKTTADWLLIADSPRAFLSLPSHPHSGFLSRFLAQQPDHLLQVRPSVTYLSSRALLLPFSFSPRSLFSHGPVSDVLLDPDEQEQESTDHDHGGGADVEEGGAGGDGGKADGNLTQAQEMEGGELITGKTLPLFLQLPHLPNPLSSPPPPLPPLGTPPVASTVQAVARAVLPRVRMQAARVAAAVVQGAVQRLQAGVHRMQQQLNDAERRAAEKRTNLSAIFTTVLQPYSSTHLEAPTADNAASAGTTGLSNTGIDVPAAAEAEQVAAARADAVAPAAGAAGEGESSVIFVAAMAYARVYREDRFNFSAYEIWQWLEYGRYAGVQHVFWYDTAHSQEESQEAALAPYVRAGMLTYHRFYRLFPEWHDIHYEQDSSVSHFLKTYGTRVRWAVLCDIDEYMFSPSDTLPGFLLRFLTHHVLPASNTTAQVLVQNLFFQGAPTCAPPCLLVDAYTQRSAHTEGPVARTKAIVRVAQVQGNFGGNPHKFWMKGEPIGGEVGELPLGGQAEGGGGGEKGGERKTEGGEGSREGEGGEDGERGTGGVESGGKGSVTVVAHPSLLRMNHYWGLRAVDFNPWPEQDRDKLIPDASIGPIADAIRPRLMPAWKWCVEEKTLQDIHLLKASIADSMQQCRMLQTAIEWMQAYGNLIA